MDEKTAASPAAEETPPPGRLAILAIVAVLLGGYLVYARYINPPKPEVKYYDTLNAAVVQQQPQWAIDTSRLSPEQLQTVLAWANQEKCACGMNNCAMTVAECRHKDPGCTHSQLKAYQKIAEVLKVPVESLLPKPSIPTPAATGSPLPSPAAPSSPSAASPSPKTAASPTPEMGPTDPQ